ncbi:CoA transferase [Cupriavidus sp. UME77]|uniref:CoA transferase n=1 Tax=Cupriavidus sp. UME77 TaxID=1862321 RepID=UPI0021080C58|nr:CoA transferase [Cupriavidus sp. UME77]
MTTLFLTRTRAQWCELLEGSDACFAPILDWDEAPQHPHNRARETLYPHQAPQAPEAPPPACG